jgi:beta-1,4-mannosyl-glycoprotein beta-1,4-N-acetylglucosaminyltransferase
MIYDCFTFFNELDLLEIRLNTLNNVVDKFVLVEATRTHQGKEKSLHFAENKLRYSAFMDKIIHVVVDEYPEYEEKSAWVLERHQRNMISKGLKDCQPSDNILVSDIDEIPNPDEVRKYSGKPGIKIFHQRMYYYFINCINATDGEKYRWKGTVMCKAKDNVSPQEMRYLSIIYAGKFTKRLRAKLYCQLRLFYWQIGNLKRIVPVYDGGWHFTYLGGVNMILNKLEAFAHTEYNKEKYKDAKSIEEAINKGEDIFGRNFSYKFIQLDNSFPKYILENIHKFSHLIKN